MPFDLSNEEEQREFVPGPVPGGSVVMVEMEVLTPSAERQAPDDTYVSQAQTGLRQLYCQFVVAHGSYAGVRFRQNITLPVGQQKIRLTQQQERSCHIGGAMLKAICLAARKPTRLNAWQNLTGLKFPAKLKINQRPTQKEDGRTYWNNEIAFVLTPEKELYGLVAGGGEHIIENGPVSGNGSSTRNRREEQAAPSEEGVPGGDTPPVDSYDDIPF